MYPWVPLRIQRLVKTGFNQSLLVLEFPESGKTEDRTAVTVFSGPENLQSFSVKVRFGHGFFPVLWLDLKALFLIPTLSLVVRLTQSRQTCPLFWRSIMSLLMFLASLRPVHYLCTALMTSRSILMRVPNLTVVLWQFLDKNLNNGFVHPLNSSHSTPILFVKKKNSSLHLCVDLSCK